MEPLKRHLPALITVAVLAVLIFHGPIAQLPHYHEFGDQRVLLGIPNGADVLSNLGFLVVGLIGLYKVPTLRRHPSFANSWLAIALFFIALVLTAFGSAYYHVAPDNARLLWDRLPIALACAALIAAVRGETVIRQNQMGFLVLMTGLAVASVLWWLFTERQGQGDLRPYLLLQSLPLVLIPLWQWLYGKSTSERWAFGGAILLYALAKAAELNDEALLEALGWISGHTIKHLLAAAGAGLITAWILQRSRYTEAANSSIDNVSRLQSAQP